MAIDEAERAFAKMMRLPALNQRALLRDILMRQRVTKDSGVDYRTLRNQDVRRQRAMEVRAHEAIERGVGAASGTVSAPELLFGDPLPACDRWGVAVAPHLGGPKGRLHEHETLGHEGRPSLPSAALVKVDARMGPHASIKAQLEMATLPCVSYNELLAHTLDAAFGNVLIDYGMAVHMDVCVQHVGRATTERDIRAHQQDGARRWPPLALRDAATADAVAGIVVALAEAAERCLPKGRRSGLGTAGVDMYWRVCIEQLERTDVKLETLSFFRALGVCAYVRQSSILVELHRRALTVALVCHARGSASLGSALERLAGVIVRCKEV